MSDKLITGIVGILAAIVGVAIIAVLVSRQSKTADVIGAAGRAFGGIIGTAVSPVAGSGGGIFNFTGQGGGGQLINAGFPTLGGLGF